ncbi:hypothetical protein [Clostridium sp.]|uniref:hypothetical protein n=1 Tax=Clostridium sp. TaxID=1506 RepID=UPI0025F7AD70|nr:hypothetical protein [uncultured Clostridium sp.]MDU4883169.1 hypothetical protein [Clostridium celatum]MDU7078372.1 hypothetical protein [Clostridium celatum]
MNNREIYLVLSRTGTMFSNIIALFTQKEYSHVSLSLDSSFTQMFSFGRKIPNKVLPAGLVEENLYDGVFAMYPNSRCLVYKINITDKQFNFLQDEINNFFENKDDYKYSVLGTVTAYFNKPHKREYYYFCSQFVAELLINSGIYKTDKLPEVIKPMDLLEIENKTLFYEGFINEDRAIKNNFIIFNSQRLSRVISRLIS